MILYSAQGKLPVGIMAVIMTFVPILTYCISIVLRIEKFLWMRASGILLAGSVGFALSMSAKSFGLRGASRISYSMFSSRYRASRLAEG